MRFGKPQMKHTASQKDQPLPFEKEFLVTIDFNPPHHTTTNNHHTTHHRVERHRTYSDASNMFDFYDYDYESNTNNNICPTRPRAYTDDSRDSDCDPQLFDENAAPLERCTVKISPSPKGGILTFDHPRLEEVSTTASMDSLSSSSICSLSTLDTFLADDDENDENDDVGRNVNLTSEMNLEASQMEDLRFPLIDTNVHRPKHSKSTSIGETFEAFKIAFVKSIHDDNQTSSSTTIASPVSFESDMEELDDEKTQKRKTEQTHQFKPPWDIPAPTTPKPHSTIVNTRNRLEYVHTVKLLLRPEDEIHASPCQCALKLVGLVSAPPLHQSIINRSNQPSVLSGNDPKRPSYDKHPPPNLLSTRTDGNYVRTVSGKAHDETRPNTTHYPNSQYPVLSAEQHQMILGGPIASPGNVLPPVPTMRSAVSIFPKMSSPGMFSTLHEVTLIRSISSSTSSSNIDKHIDSHNEVEEDWSSVTIQCRDHDEMDSLIRALRDSSRSKVIPFSINPKSKLKKRHLFANPRTMNRKSSHSKSSLGPQVGISYKRNDVVGNLSSPSIKHNIFHNKEECELCHESFTLLHRRHHCRSCMISCCSKCSSIHPDGSGKHTRYCKSCKNVNLCMYKKPGNQFHNHDHCELCTLHFTLLTRRHHCRKCDRSCCSSCSSIIMIKGGIITRYCNQCNNKLRNSLNASAISSLPGKVHPACNNLGVGVVGKIPHWINFLNPDDNARPAVARLTVELIEAIALPTLGFHGNIDPYVRATITGYDYDMKLNLKEWFPHKRFTLSGTYSAATTSPVWLGPGRHGGELLTLPVLRTSGAVLRLEVLHYDVMKNSKGKDNVLGVVEIPLADIPNANLRETTVMKKKGCKAYDGFVNRWYQLQTPIHSKNRGIMLATPMDDPTTKISSAENNFKTETHGLPSWEELGQKTQALFVAPVDWISSALNLDIPRHPTINDYHRRSQSAAIHIRLKLNASEMGDLLSHAWFPLVPPKPDILPFDPQILWSNINKVLKELDPYLKLLKFCEDVIKWKHSPMTCIIGFLIVVFHLFYIDKVIYLLHLYLIQFLVRRLGDMRESSGHLETLSSSGIRNCDSFDSGSLGRQSLQSATLDSESEDCSISESAISSSVHPIENSPKNANGKIEQELHLNKTLSWIAKIIGENRGLEHVQHKLATMHQDLRNVNTLWDGSSKLKTRATILCVSISFLVHLFVNHKLLWIVGIACLHFSKSPDIIRVCRMIFGFNRGLAQIITRRHLHLFELNQSQKSSCKES